MSMFDADSSKLRVGASPGKSLDPWSPLKQISFLPHFIHQRDNFLLPQFSFLHIPSFFHISPVHKEKTFFLLRNASTYRVFTFSSFKLLKLEPFVFYLEKRGATFELKKKFFFQTLPSGILLWPSKLSPEIGEGLFIQYVRIYSLR